jgi:hypothetical protein
MAKWGKIGEIVVSSRETTVSLVKLLFLPVKSLSLPVKPCLSVRPWSLLIKPLKLLAFSLEFLIFLPETQFEDLLLLNLFTDLKSSIAFMYGYMSSAVQID